VDGMTWTLRRIGFMSDEELEAEKERHRDDGEGWCAAGCKTGMFLHWHPCAVYEAVAREQDRRRYGGQVSA
jgi:hypothetical protein